MNNYIVLDLETSSLDWKTGKIIAAAYIGKTSKVLYHQDETFDIIGSIPLDTDILIFHNAAFDLKFLWKDEKLQTLFKEGLTIWDTMYAEYLLTGQQAKFAGLRDIAVNKYGCKERVKLMEEYWKKGISTTDIPKDLVIEDVTNDVLDTEQVYLKQLEEAKKLNLLPLVEGRMDGLLGLIEMEVNGIYVNKEVLNRNKKVLEDKLQLLYTDLNEMIKPYWRSTNE